MKRCLLALSVMGCAAVTHATEIENSARLRAVVQQTFQSFERAAEGGYRASHSPSGAKFAFSESGVATVQSGANRLSVVAKQIGRQGYASVSPVGTPALLKTGTDRFGWPTLELKRSGLTEQYVSARGGMRHTFQIQARPTGETGNAFVKVAVSGATKIEALAKTALQFQVGGSTFQYSNLTVWDAKNRRLPAKLVPAKDGYFISIDDRSAAYPVSIDPDWSFTKRFNHPTDSEVDTVFGSAFAVDGFTVAIGAQRDDWLGTNQGKVYIFVYNGTDWVLQQAIQQSNTAVVLPFGRTVSLDGNRLAVGAGGLVYIFERTGSTWNQVAELAENGVDFSDFAADNRFFKLVRNRLIVGAPGHLNKGKLYMFAPVGGVWQETFSVLGADGQALGRSIGFDGNRVVVLAGDTVQVYNVGATTLTLAATVPIPADATSTDVSGDRIAVGFPLEGDGVVRIYTPSGATFSLAQTILSPYNGDPETIDYGGGEIGTKDSYWFGWYVDLMGDVLGVDLSEEYESPGNFNIYGNVALFRITNTTANFTDYFQLFFAEYTRRPPLFQLQSGRMLVGIWTQDFSEYQNTNWVNLYDLTVPGLNITFGGTYEVGGRTSLAR